MSSHMQQLSTNVRLGLAQPRQESVIQVPAAMTDRYRMWPRAPHQFSGLQPRLQPPVQQQFSRFQPPVPQYFSPVKTMRPNFTFGSQKNSSPLNPQHKSVFHRDAERGREKGNRRLVTDLQSTLDVQSD